MSQCKHYLVHGRVQGVSFRASAQSKAQELGLTGWVRNLPDGEVEAVAQGEEAILDSFERWLWQGPEFARVTQVETRAAKPGELGNPRGFGVC